MGYHRAGFEVVGVDIVSQPRYPFRFHRADALTFPLEEFDVVHASPPCQRFTALKSMWNSVPHADLLTPIRKRLEGNGIPWIIENVPGAPMQKEKSIVLCGTMFGLGIDDAQLRRHRYFELSTYYLLTPPCNHSVSLGVIGIYGGHGRDRRRTISVHGSAGGSSNRNGTQDFSTDQRRKAMGIDWMTGVELSQAIPPAYTEFIGRHMMQQLRRAVSLE